MATSILAEVGYSFDTSALKKASTDLKKAANDAENLDNKMGKTDKSSKKMSVSFAKVATTAAAIGVAIIAAGVGLASYTVTQARANRELAAFAKTGNVAMNTMIALGTAASQYGIGQQQVADNLKDLQDKMGDFINTGGGPMKDVFEVLGTTLKFTAAELAAMSGPNALGAITDAMDEANLSATQQTHLLEGLGNDLSIYADVYRDGGKAIREATVEMVAFNQVISGNEREKLNDSAVAVESLTRSWDAFSTKLAAKASPALATASGWMQSILNSASSLLGLDELSIVDIKSIESASVLEEIRVKQLEEQVRLKGIIAQGGAATASDHDRNQATGAGFNLTEVDARVIAIDEKIAELKKTKAKETAAAIAETATAAAVKTISDKAVIQEKLDAAQKKSDELGLEQIRVSMLSEEQVREEAYQKKKELIERVITDEADKNARLLELELQHTTNMTALRDGIAATELARAEKTDKDAKDAKETADQAVLDSQGKFTDGEKDKLSTMESSFGMLASATSKGNGKLKGINKAFMVGEAIASGALAANKALSSAPPPLNFILAAATAALAAGNVASIVASAKGNAFDGGNVTPFANGGAFTNSVVSQPTMAPMALFGEAGPEAIMPLKRGKDGSLGIQSVGGSGGGGSTVINIEGNATEETVAQLEELVNSLADKRIGESGRSGNQSNPYRMNNTFGRG